MTAVVKLAVLLATMALLFVSDRVVAEPIVVPLRVVVLPAVIVTVAVMLAADPGVTRTFMTR